MTSPSKRRELDITKLLLSDHDVELVDDNISEFYITFHGPKESACVVDGRVGGGGGGGGRTRGLRVGARMEGCVCPVSFPTARPAPLPPRPGWCRAGRTVVVTRPGAPGACCVCPSFSLPFHLPHRSWLTPLPPSPPAPPQARTKAACGNCTWSCRR